MAFQNNHFFNAVQKSKTFQLQFTCKAEKSPFENLMKEIQLVTLDNSGFQQWSNVEIKESSANADKQKPDAIKGTNNIRKNQTSTIRSCRISFYRENSKR